MINPCSIKPTHFCATALISTTHHDTELLHCVKHAAATVMLRYVPNAVITVFASSCMATVLAGVILDPHTLIALIIAGPAPESAIAEHAATGQGSKFAFTAPRASSMCMLPVHVRVSAMSPCSCASLWLTDTTEYCCLKHSSCK